MKMSSASIDIYLHLRILNFTRRYKALLLYNYGTNIRSSRTGIAKFRSNYLLRLRILKTSDFLPSSLSELDLVRALQDVNQRNTESLKAPYNFI